MRLKPVGFKAHKTPQVLSAFKNIGVQSFYVPPGFTESLQRLDVSVNKPVKEILREEWSQWFQESPIYTKQGNRQKPSYESLLNMVAAVYKKMSSRRDLICKVSKKKLPL